MDQEGGENGGKLWETFVKTFKVCSKGREVLPEGVSRGRVGLICTLERAVCREWEGWRRDPG